MSLTKRQKTLSAVFLVGLIGLVVDRTILRPQGGPQAASASSSSRSSAPGTAASGVPAGDQSPGPMPVAERLNKLAAGKEMGSDAGRDPFVLPLSWSEAGSGSGERTPDPIRRFVQKHRLNAVVLRKGEYCALVDDHDDLLSAGQSVEGFTLVSVTPTSAVFEREGQRAILEMAVK